MEDRNERALLHAVKEQQRAKRLAWDGGEILRFVERRDKALTPDGRLLVALYSALGIRLR